MCPFCSGLDAGFWAINRAWVRIGLFGGGFGVLIDDGADQNVYFLGAQLIVSRISIEFKIDATYRNAIMEGLTRVLTKVMTLAQRILNVFEALKNMVKKGLTRLLDRCCDVQMAMDAMLASLSEDAVGAITRVMPRCLPSAPGSLGSSFSLAPCVYPTLYACRRLIGNATRSINSVVNVTDWAMATVSKTHCLVEGDVFACVRARASSLVTHTHYLPFRWTTQLCGWRVLALICLTRL